MIIFLIVWLLIIIIILVAGAFNLAKASGGWNKIEKLSSKSIEEFGTIESEEK
jgi:hypothetical protein